MGFMRKMQRSMEKKTGFGFTRPSQVNTLNNALAMMPPDRLPAVRQKTLNDMKKPMRIRIKELNKANEPVTPDKLVELIYADHEGELCRVFEKRLGITRDDWNYIANEVIKEMGK